MTESSTRSSTKLALGVYRILTSIFVANALDWMICEFGHNELGSYHSSDKAALPGISGDTKEIVNGKGRKEVIRTFGGVSLEGNAQDPAADLR